MSQVQVYEPSVSEQVALSWQLSVSKLHSSISKIKVPRVNYIYINILATRFFYVMLRVLKLTSCASAIDLNVDLI